MRTLLAAALVVAMVGSGCAGNESGDDAGEGATSPLWLEAQELPWTMTGCRFLAAVLEAPLDVVQPLVPEGFRVMSPQEFAGEGVTGVDVPATDAGNVGVEAFQCEAGQGLNGSVAGMTYASYYIGVDPPQEYDRGNGYTFIKLDVMIPDEDRRDLLALYGVPVTNGTATVTTGPTTGLPVHVIDVEADLSFGELGQFALSGTAAAPYPIDCAFTEFTPVPAGFVEWTMACEFVQGGIGPLTVEVPAGSWLADIVGAGPVDGAGFIGIIDFAQGSIKLPEGNATLPA
jgi:hypothetical protein